MIRPLIATLTGAMILFWLLALGLGVLVMRHEMDEIFDSALQETARRLMVLIEDDPRARTGAAPAILVRGASGNPEYLTYQLRDREGKLVLRSTDAPDQPFDAPLAAGFHDLPKLRIYTEPDAVGQRFLQVADRFSNRREAVRESAVTMLIPLAALIPASILAIGFITRRALRPVDTLRREITARDGGNMTPVESDGLPRELKPMALSVNLLLERLGAAFAAEREFAANSAHELRTPIAGALAQTQRLVAELPDGPARERAGKVESALRALGQLAAKLLQLARADAGIGTTGRSTDLRIVLDMVVDDFRRENGTDNRLEYGVDDLPPIAVDPDAFGIVLRNLIENALIHGDPDRPVRIVGEKDGTIRIINGCPVIPPAELAALRQRFRRGRTQAAGSGIGLAIAERVVTQTGGRLELLSPAQGEAGGFEARIVPDRA